MKTLFQNYSSVLSTEPMYFHRCLIEAGGEAVMWHGEQQNSAFDTFDYVKPDVFVTHFKFLTQDVVKYLSGNKNIGMVLNVTGATPDDIGQIQDLGNHLNLITTFTNLYDANNNLRGTGSNVNGIYPGADLFLPVMPTPEYKIKNCILSLDNNSQLQEVKSNEEEYHVISFNPNPDEKYSDMMLDITSAVSFYEKYERCHLVGDINFVSSQILFDSLLKAESVKIKVPEGQQEMLNSIFGALFKEPAKVEDMAEIIKTQVKRRHNCFKRTSRLCRFLKNSEMSSKLEKIGESI